MNDGMRILVGYDGSEYAGASLDDLQRAGLPNEAEAIITTVDEGGGAPSPSGFEIVGEAFISRGGAAAGAVASRTEAHALAVEGGRRLQSLFPQWEVRAEAASAAPAEAILRKAKEWGADLIVVGSQGRSALGRLILGSVSQKIADEAHCSVRVARPRRENGASPVQLVVAYDSSPGARAAVSAAARRAWTASRVHVVSVDDRSEPTGVRPTEAGAGRVDKVLVRKRRRGDAALEKLRSAAGLNVSLEVEEAIRQAFYSNAPAARGGLHLRRGEGILRRRRAASLRYCRGGARHRGELLGRDRAHGGGEGFGALVLIAFCSLSCSKV